MSALPVLTLFFVLLVLRKRVWVSALCGMVMAVVIAAAVFGMPAPLIAAAGLNGFVFGFFRIAWIVIASIYLYNVAVETGQFQVMKESIAGVSSDRRLQVILIAFCFGAFLEGTGGGGAPVAIAGSFLIGLGFPHFQAATLCLLANTAPVAWGGVGNPIRVLNGVTGLPDRTSSTRWWAGSCRPSPSSSRLARHHHGRLEEGPRGPARAPRERRVVRGHAVLLVQLPGDGPRRHRGRHLLAAGDGGLPALLEAPPPDGGRRGGAHDRAARARRPDRPQGLVALRPGLGPRSSSGRCPASAQYLKIPALTFPTPWLHNAVIRTAPVVPVPTPETASIDLNFFALPGTAVFLGAFLVAPFLGMGVGRALRLLGQTFRQLVPSMLAMTFMVGLAYVTKYAGMDTVMGLSLTRTGWIYPFFGTLLGWMGVALTGTDAGSNALFGNLQKVTAEQIGISPVLMASANSAGGVMGKMIDAQSIVVASTSCGLAGREADVFKAVFRHSLLLASLVGLLVLVYAYVTPWVIPGSRR